MEKRNEMTIYEKRSRERINNLITTFCEGSQQRFSERTKLNKASVSQYVNGKNTPSNITASKIAKEFGVDPAWLMGFDVPMEPVPSGSGLSTAPASSPVAPVQLRSDESELLVKYNLLNGIGKKEANRHMNYLCSQEEYIKDTASEESNKVS